MIAITIKECKTLRDGETVTVWGCNNPNKESDLCLVKSLKRHWRARFRDYEEVFSRSVPLLANYTEKGKRGFVTGTEWSKFIKIYENGFGAKNVK